MLATWGCTTFPKPTLSLDFLGATSLDSGITFSRGSQATLFDSTGTLVYAKHNLLLQSQDFATTWSRTNGDVTANAATAPDGTLTADKFIPNTTAGVHYPSQSVTTNTVIHTASVYLKAGEYSWAILYVAGAGVGYYFDIANGAVGNAFIAAPTSFSIQSVGDGWRRYSITFTATASTTVRIYAATANGTNSFSGDGTSGIFIWGAQLNQNPMEGGVTSSLTTYYPTTTAAYYAPRFDYNPSTLQPRGLLIEEQRTNLETYSEDFSNAVWVKTNSTISSNAIIAPSGQLTGDKLIADATTSIHSMTIPSRVYTINVAYAMSIFAKAGEYNTFSIIRSGPGGASARFDLSTLTATILVGTSASITSVGNGWYRCEMTWTSTQTIARTHELRLENPSGTSTFLGDGYSGMFFWGIQTEAGAFATSYIPTTTTALTRNADVASMTGTNFSSWYNASEGTIYTQAIGVNNISSATRRFAEITELFTLERLISGYSTTTNTRFLVQDGGSTQADVQVSTGVPAGSLVKMAAAYKVNDFQQASNGTLGTADISGTLPTPDRMFIGDSVAPNNTNINGWVQRIAYYPTLLPNATLQALTL